MDEQLEFLSLIAKRLGELEIPYMLSGSVALSMYAEPRMTRDIDIVIDLQASKVGSFVRAFGQDCYVDEHAVQDAVRRHDMFNIIHNEWIIKADFVVRKDQPYRIEEFKRRRTVLVQDVSLSVVTPEDLLLSKLVWAKAGDSAQQRNDIKNLLQSSTLDRDYVAQWARDLNVLELLEELRSPDE